ncbi:MAG: hypothetical protein ACM34I_03475 [bacterium]
MKEMILGIDDCEERLKKIWELNFKLLRLNELRKKPFNLEDFAHNLFHQKHLRERYIGRHFQS